MEHILSLSYGKDSLACLGAIKKLGLPLDRIIHAVKRFEAFGGRRAGTACRMDRKESGDPCATDGRCAD